MGLPRTVVILVWRRRYFAYTSAPVEVFFSNLAFYVYVEYHLMQVRNWIAKWLTRGYVRTLDFSGVSREELYQAHGEERKVFWVNADNWPMGGQYTPFGTIILNESKLEDTPNELVDYVFLHEVGHSEFPTILSLGSLIARIPLMFFAVFGIPLLIVRWLVFAISGPSLSQLAAFSVASLLVALLILLPLVVISWLDEGYAELFVVSRIGKEAYQHCLEMKKEHSDRSIIGLVLRPLYPPPRLVLRIANVRGL